MFKKELIAIVFMGGIFSVAAVVASEASRKMDDERPYAKYANYYGISESEARRRAVISADVGVTQEKNFKEIPRYFLEGSTSKTHPISRLLFDSLRILSEAFAQ